MRPEEKHLICEKLGQKIDNIHRDLLLLFFQGYIVVVGKMTMSKVACDQRDLIPIVVYFHVTDLRVFCRESHTRSYSGFCHGKATRETLRQ